MPPRKYLTRRIGGIKFWVCQDCFAVIDNQEGHQDWHQRLVDILKIIVDAT